MLAISGLDAGLASLISSLDSDRREFRINLNRIVGLMKHYQVNAMLESRILRYYEYMWDRYTGVDERAVLESLPTNLRGAVTLSFMNRVLIQLPYFTRCDSLLLEKILAQLVPRQYLKDDEVVAAFSDLSECIIIERGRIEITDSTRTTSFKVLSTGEALGETTLLSNQPVKQSDSAFALGYCDVFVLSQQGFAEIISAKPQAIKSIILPLKEHLAMSEQMNTLISKKARRDSISPQFRKIRKQSALKQYRRVATKCGLNIDTWHPDSFNRGLWNLFLFVINVYILVMIPLRLAVTIPDQMYYLDYAFDFLVICDSLLVFQCFRLTITAKSCSNLRNCVSDFGSRLGFMLMSQLAFHTIFWLWRSYHTRLLSHITPEYS